MTHAGNSGALTSSARARAIALDIARHTLPLIPFYLGRGSILNYLLLTAFDLSLGLMLIVGTTRDRNDPTTVDPRATWLISRLTAVLVLAVFLGLVAAIISLPMSIPAVISGLAKGVDWGALFSHPGFWIPAAAMALLTGARAQHSFESVTTPGKIDFAPRGACHRQSGARSPALQGSERGTGDDHRNLRRALVSVEHLWTERAFCLPHPLRNAARLLRRATRSGATAISAALAGNEIGL